MTDRELNVIIETANGNVGFRFSTWVIRETQRRAECKGVISLLQKIGVDDGDIDSNTLAILIEEAHNEFLKFTKSEDKPIAFKEACDLIDDMGGLIIALHKMGEGLTMHVPKNPEPPQPVGEKILQSTT
jgi:hypothetical protein